MLYNFLFNNKIYTMLFSKRNIKIFLSLFAIIFILSSIIFIPKIKYVYDYINTPFNTNVLVSEKERAINILDRNNILLSTLYPEHGGKYKEVVYSDLPQVLIDAVISAEDKNFFTHNGIDFKAVIRAFISNIKARKIVSGASTITQQLVKNIENNERSYKNKVYEMFDAVRLEKELSKESIITLYLNNIFFGNNIYGVGAASEVYFNKPIGSITVKEASILASIIKSGTKFNPYKKTYSLNSRSLYVLKEMKDNEFITESIYNESVTNTAIIYKNAKNIFKAPHFSMYVKSAFDSLKLKEVVEIKTTLDYKIQEEIMLVIKNTTQSLESYNVRNISCVVLDAKTGAIVSMIGSLNYNDKEDNGAVNGATSLRQPGSTLKPFLYGYLFEEGETPASVIADTKTYIASSGGEYIPDNFDKKFRGPVTIRYALANSLNVPAVKWLANYKIKDFQNVLLKSGLTSITKNPDYYGYALALGSAEVRLLDLASAYTVFSQDGIFKNNYSIENIKTSKNEIIYMPKKKHKRVFSHETSYLVTSILSDKRMRLSSFPNLKSVVYPFSIALKTGTSKNFRDAWVVGYTKDYIVAIWLGDFKGSEMINVTGGSGASPILYDIFSMLNKEQKATVWNKPSTMIEREICLMSGKLKTVNCSESMLEIFSSKNVIEEYCDFHKLYTKEKDGVVYNQVFLDLPREYETWQTEREMTIVDSTWTNTEMNSIAFYEPKNRNKKTVSMKAPKHNSIYRIDNNIPLKYQRIDVATSLKDDEFSDITIYQNEEIIARENNVRWTLEKGHHIFYAEIKYKNGEYITTPKVSIYVD